MRPINRILQNAAFFFLLLCITTWAEFVPVPYTPDHSYRLAGWLLTANDGFGHNLGADVDNLRTFGANLGVASDRWYFSAEAFAFTDRNTADSLSRRIDEIKPLAGYRFLHLTAPAVNFSLTGGLGGAFYGNFGGQRIQESAHNLGTEVVRPVPQTVDGSSAHALGFLSSDLYLPTTCLDLGFYVHLTHTLDYNAEISLGYWAIKPLLQVQGRLSWQANSVTHAGSAARNIYAAENGPWFSSRELIGPFVIERGFNFRDLNQYSYVGFRLDANLIPSDDPTPGYRITYALGVPIGHNSWVEIFRIHPFVECPRLSFFLHTYETENLIDDNVTKNTDDRLIRRMKVASIGSEWYLCNPDEYNFLNGFVFLGGGFNREMLSTYDVYQAEFLELYTIPIIHAGGGLRVDIPDFLYRKKGRYVGAEIMATFRYGFADRFLYTNPDLLLSWQLVFSER